jgi:hypothetical protein
MYLRDLWRRPFTDTALAGQVGRLDAANQSATGYDRTDNERLALTTAAKGLPASELDGSQRDLLRALLAAYLGRIPDGISPRPDYDDDATLDEIHLAWAGPTEPGRPLYYRLQAPRLVIEYDNTQRNANHAHSVWRDPAADFGYDALGAHLEAQHW